jgi:3-oxoacyl-[acyl-carrier protein] reductase
MNVLENRVCVVTGAARGIGEAIATEFAIEKAKVVMADIDLAEVSNAAARLQQLSHNVTPLQVDVSNESSVEKMFQSVREKYGVVHVLVNNAGIYPRHKFEETTLEQWERIQAVNVRGCFLCSRAALSFFKQQGGGKIINLSSVTFWVGAPADLVHYITSKGAVIGFTRSLARDLGALNIQVNAITPGGVESEEEKKYATPEQVAAVVALQSLKRRVVPRDIARTAVFLASSDSDIITGQTINVDAGWAMH